MATNVIEPVLEANNLNFRIVQKSVNLVKNDHPVQLTLFFVNNVLIYVEWFRVY